MEVGSLSLIALIVLCFILLILLRRLKAISTQLLAIEGWARLTYLSTEIGRLEPDSDEKAMDRLAEDAKRDEVYDRMQKQANKW